MICQHCGEPIEIDDLLHVLRCDGRQGAVEAAAELAPITVNTITTPRETSVQAFYNAVDTGVIHTRREQAYVALRDLNARFGPTSANETFEYQIEQRHLGLRYDSNTRARFTELRDMGFIREVGTKVCRVTGQTCIAWEVVPEDEYAGPATVHRCPTCNQIISRDVPTSKGDDDAELSLSDH